MSSRISSTALNVREKFGRFRLMRCLAALAISFIVLFAFLLIVLVIRRQEALRLSESAATAEFVCSYKGWLAYQAAKTALTEGRKDDAARHIREYNYWHLKTDSWMREKNFRRQFWWYGGSEHSGSVMD
jgi:hypothetical protein